MANLNDWQKITRVLPGQPFGDGADGAYSSATIPTLVKDSCSGTATSTTLTTAGSTFANGDLLLIHQTRGTGVGQWEVNQVLSGGGSTSLTLKVSLNYTYTDSGASQAQAVKIFRYTDATAQTGTWTIPAWDGNTGGVFPMAVKGTMTVTGNITGAGKGFLGDYGGSHASQYNGADGQGEGTAGAGNTDSQAANGNGGGGGDCEGSSPNRGEGGGGGHANAGGTGTAYSSGVGGTGGSAVGTADLISMNFGGGGGGYERTSPGAEYKDNGGNGGGIFAFFAKNISIAGTIVLDGTRGGTSGPGAGSGAGGAGLFVCATATLGTALTTSLGATANATGIGSVGRIAVHHSGTVTGTTTPTFTDVTDATLKESSGFIALL